MPREEEGRRRRGRQVKGEVACYSGKKREREGEGVRGFLTPNNSQPKRQNYP